MNGFATVHTANTRRRILSKGDTGLSYLISSEELFYDAMSNSVSISDAAIGIEHTGRQNRTLFIFAKLIAHSMAVAALLEKYHSAPVGAKMLDHFSIAALGRAVIDASLMVMYISEASLNRNEWDLRRQVLFFHDLTNRKRFLTSMAKAGAPRDEAFFDSYVEIKSDLKQKIQELAVDQGFSAEEQDNLASGQAVYLRGVRGAAREAGWDVAEFDFQQSYLSNWVHSHPVSFMRADQHKISFSDPSEYQLGFVGLVLEICSHYLNEANSRLSIFSGDISKDPVGPFE